ncbi:MAG: WG repeat-containing protein, partial [Candidatus Omnitrophica bacterium]|nr:WG repeat-containing protein [Candidatus Omnitrophota bacterium]
MTKKGILLLILIIVILAFFAGSNFRQGERLFAVKVDGKWGLIDRHGKLVVKPQFSNLNFWSEGLTGVEINKRWGFIDDKGKVVIPAQFDNVGMFSEGLAAVTINGKHGYINKKGKIIIRPQYYTADKFHEGLAAVWTNGEEYGYINRQGKTAIKPKIPRGAMFPYRFAGWPTSDFSNGLACIWIKDGSKYSFIDKKGNIKKWRFDWAQDFSEGLAPVAKEINGNLKVGYIDTTGRLAIDYKFDMALPFTEGLAAVWIDKEFFYIDKKGSIVFKVNADNGGVFSD